MLLPKPQVYLSFPSALLLRSQLVRTIRLSAIIETYIILRYKTVYRNIVWKRGLADQTDYQRLQSQSQSLERRHRERKRSVKKEQSFKVFRLKIRCPTIISNAYVIIREVSLMILRRIAWVLRNSSSHKRFVKATQLLSQCSYYEP